MFERLEKKQVFTSSAMAVNAPLLAMSSVDEL